MPTYFTDFDFSDTLLDAIHYMNFKEATEIQEKAIPHILEGKDLIGCAQTGTGKTAAFVLPTLQLLCDEDNSGVQVLILCPTRELAVQIDRQVQGLAYFTNHNCHSVYGGRDGVDWASEERALKGGADIIIATPGRLLAHIDRGYCKFSGVRHLILDEADRMLDIGFFDDIVKIIGQLPKKRQSLMFSATMADKIRKLANQILDNPLEVSVAVSKPAEGVTQEVYMAHEDQKNRMVKHLLKDKDGFQAILVFCSTKKKVEQLSRQLKRSNYNAEGISSDYAQKEREETLAGFRSGRTRILVATDVMSRGIDIKGIDLVINYDVPTDAEDYVHRIGRTARAKSKGMAITFVCQEDMYRFVRIEELIERQLDKKHPPEHIGNGPEWDASAKKSRYSSGGRGGRPQSGGGNGGSHRGNRR
jgi:ATP-dependent RNA helicase RhlE